jgi:hypothetical protein
LLNEGVEENFALRNEAEPENVAPSKTAVEKVAANDAGP